MKGFLSSPFIRLSEGRHFNVLGRRAKPVYHWGWSEEVQGPQGSHACPQCRQSLFLLTCLLQESFHTLHYL